MKRQWSRLTQSLFFKISLFLCLGILLVQLGSFWFFFDERQNALTVARGEGVLNRIVETVRRLEEETPEARINFVKRPHADDVHITLISENEVFQTTPRGPLLFALRERLGEGYEIRTNDTLGGRGMRGSMHADRPMRGVRAHERLQSAWDIRLKDGTWVRLNVSQENRPAFLPASLFWQLGATFVLVLMATLFAVKQATKPLSKLAKAAHDFGQNLEVRPMPEEGSQEMKEAAAAFNLMQKRICGLIDERSRALAALSHDLRTPITRLRLRAEMIEEGNLREPFLNDLSTMTLMLDHTLRYLRGLKNDEAVQAIDMNALLEGMIEEAALLQHTVLLEGRANKPYTGRHLALKRAFQNLIDNALQYGNNVKILVEDSEEELFVSVIDEGRGVPEPLLAKLTEAYFRADTARRVASGSVGLGLSIVKEVAERHKGHLVLQNLVPQGFCARLSLPRQSQ